MVTIMAIRTWIDKLRQRLRKFSAAQGGNVLMTFALSSIPLIGFVGAAVDYSRANAARSAMQSAIDATALMLSKNITSLTDTQVQSEASNYFNALFNHPDVTNVVIKPYYTNSGGSQITVTGQGTLNTSFMRIVGQDMLNISVSSTVKWGNSRLRVALVLDNTGSMADNGKMSALKTATKNLLTQLQNAAAQNGDVYVSIVPFVKDVAVDPVNYTQSWVGWTDWNNNNGTCKNYWGWSQPQNKSNCQSQGGSWTTANHSTWNGCITDRGTSSAPSSGNYDTNVAAPVTTNTATLYPAEQYSACPQAVMPLSYSWSAMTTLVNNMSPNGNTNQAIGLVWGWLSLVGGGPFPTPPAMDPNYKYQQIIILLTDGLNTQDRWYSDQNSIDNRQSLTCANVKNAGITLYTIQVNTGGDPTSSLLQNCASNSPGTTDHFFLLTSANEIVTTFQQIGTKLSNLRVAK
jgi:Flp pilus assembly protein TadG